MNDSTVSDAMTQIDRTERWQREREERQRREDEKAERVHQQHMRHEVQRRWNRGLGDRFMAACIAHFLNGGPTPRSLDHERARIVYALRARNSNDQRNQSQRKGDELMNNATLDELHDLPDDDRDLTPDPRPCWMLKELQWLIHSLNDAWSVDAGGNIIIPTAEWERVNEIACCVADHLESEIVS
jgi:hypothetical protein